jgi:hypothetical protein
MSKPIRAPKERTAPPVVKVERSGGKERFKTREEAPTDNEIEEIFED